MGLTGLLATAFLVAAWPGWLQGPPFEPRRWAIDTPAALPRCAEFLGRTHEGQLWPTGTGTLHVSPEAAAFAWFCPADRGVQDREAVELMLRSDNSEPARERLRARGVSRVVVYAGDAGARMLSQDALGRLLLDPKEWPVLHLSGGLVVLGWRDPAQASVADRFAGWEVDFGRLAFRPDESEVAPRARPPRGSRWWDAFWKPAPPRAPGRDEMTVLFTKSQASVRAAPEVHQRVWDASQLAGLIGAGAGWVGPHNRIDAALRLHLLQPPVTPGAPLPAITRAALGLYERLAFEQGNAPVGTLYAAIRAARRAVAENPNDANSYLTLGVVYGALVRTTAEQSWTAQLPQLRRLRQLQASASLNRAVAINPKLAQAHLQLARLYLSLQIFDLAAHHLRTYRETPPRLGGPEPGVPRSEGTAEELDALSSHLERETREYAKESERASVADRASMAVRRGLGGQALDLLLKSDVSAFGTVGTELQLNLLLLTGRPDDVLEWTTPEVRGSLGDFLYHSIRAQALIAAGEYESADAELAEMVGPGGRLPRQIGSAVAQMTGKRLLDEQPGGFQAAQLFWHVFGPQEFEGRLAELSQRLGRSADVLVLRGLVALEAGYIDRARESFRASLALSPSRFGGAQLDFRSRTTAWACLALIDGPTDFQPARQPTEPLPGTTEHRN